MSDWHILRAAATDGAAVWAAPWAEPHSPPADRPPLPPPPPPPTTLGLAEWLLRDIPPAGRESLGIVLGTTTGCLHADWEFDRSRREAEGRYASPAAFTRTLPSTPASELSVRLGLKGPTITLCAQDPALPLRRAPVYLRRFAMSACLAGRVEIHPITGVTSATLLLLSRANFLPFPLPQTMPPLERWIERVRQGYFFP